MSATTVTESKRHFALVVACLAFAVFAVAAQAMQGGAGALSIDWQTSPLDLDLRGMNGEQYAFHCPPGKPLPSRVTGSDPYTDDSSICSAAVHAGRIRPKNGGDVAIEIRTGQDVYTGSEKNFIKSASYDRAWSGSFIVLAPRAPASP